MNKDSSYQVCTSNEDVYVCIKNRASYLNCAPFRKFIKNMISEGCSKFIIDFQHCSGADSTFLGILVGLALELRKSSNNDCLNLVNLSGRNLETVQNLGIHKIANVSSALINNVKQLEELKGESENPSESSEEIYKAHKTLLELNEKNSKIFRDVVNYLEQKNDQ